MLNVGLTGGISTGKTTIARLLVEKGAILIDLDEVAHRVQMPETEVWREIVETFGEGILNPDKTINREKLGAVVFSDPAKLNRLNEIVHPAVFRAWKSRIAEIESTQPDAIALSDIPLLIEIGAQQRFDLIVLVYIPRDEQLERLILRNGYSREYAEKRITSQMSIEEKMKYARIVIDNQGILEETEKRVEEVWRELLRLEKNKREKNSLE
ncbi:MAG TPA: dephospho-CoA kinase [Syntrophales bacterium]|nr:dephospho-CoA kinase [Syntrophales bacterium]